MFFHRSIEAVVVIKSVADQAITYSADKKNSCSIYLLRLSRKSKLPEKDFCGSGFQPRSFNFAAGSRSHNQLNLLFSDNRVRIC